MREHGRERRWNIAGALSGVVFVGLMFAGMAVAGSPDVEPSDTADAIARALADRSDQTRSGSMFTLLGLAFFFPFLAYLRHRLRAAEGDDGWLHTMAYGGRLVAAAMLLLIVSVQLATTSVSAGVDQVVGKVFVVYTWNWSVVIGPPLMAFTLGSSLAIVRYGAAPRWTGWLGVFVTLTVVMPWIGLPVATVWIGLVSVALAVQELLGRDARAPQAEPAARAMTG